MYIGLSLFVHKGDLFWDLFYRHIYILLLIEYIVGDIMKQKDQKSMIRLLKRQELTNKINFNLNQIEAYKNMLNYETDLIHEFIQDRIDFLKDDIKDLRTKRAEI